MSLDLPRPGGAPGELAVAAPETGSQRWAGAPSALLDRDGSRDRVVLARSADGVVFVTIASTRMARGGPVALK